MIQFLISSGHSWAEIRGYTLGEIGVFVRATIEAKRHEANTNAKLERVRFQNAATATRLAISAAFAGKKNKHEIQRVWNEAMKERNE